MSYDELGALLVEDFRPAVKKRLEAHWDGLPLSELASVQAVQAIAITATFAVSECIYEVWKQRLLIVCEEMGRTCPGCGKQRRAHWRKNQPMRIDVLGMQIELPKLYLECEHCEAPGVSIVKLLTGLASGDASEQQKLAAAYSAAEHSYRESSRELEAHTGRTLERTKVRRLALDIEHSAMTYAEDSRIESLARLEQEGRVEGLSEILFEADGGKVRTGILEPCVPGDRGYGKTTPKWGIPRRKRPVNFREVITMDAREPHEIEPTALDIQVPIQSEEGERSRRMLALASRKGLGENTEVIGLGDMGSGLAAAFDLAFDVYPGSRWHADWKHTSDYIRNAAKAMNENSPASWDKDMRDAVWMRDEKARDALLERARAHRSDTAIDDDGKHPVDKLDTYMTNNWDNMHFKSLDDRGLPTVSARAEAQVRDRTKRRFSGPGVWRVENVETKATLRAIIAEGRWQAFCDDHLARTGDRFQRALRDRIQRAIEQRRLSADAVAAIDPDLIPDGAAKAPSPDTRAVAA